MTVMKAAAVFVKRWFQVGRGRVSVALKSHLLLSLSRTHSHQPTPEHMANLRLFLENPKKSRLSRMKQEDVLAAVVFEICARAASTRHRSQQRHQNPVSLDVWL
ncbi:Hypothetical protein, putative [Bodo saltans]|uniref:Uncharacterized protein n=1 Tax=Bodo saltans TaxID=75058 RepID=A0A0S4JLZ6_BODSA|nr:Hypothetical protein, putative [Bodo saltans]|eukprot:CUG91658.1 Hypothetical protein, putative [Bodo saltans]